MCAALPSPVWLPPKSAPGVCFSKPRLWRRSTGGCSETTHGASAHPHKILATPQKKNDRDGDEDNNLAWDHDSENENDDATLTLAGSDSFFETLATSLSTIQ